MEKMSRITLGNFPDFFSRWARWVGTLPIVKKPILKSQYKFPLRFKNRFLNNGNSVVSIPVLNIDCSSIIEEWGGAKNRIYRDLDYSYINSISSMLVRLMLK